MTARLEVSKVTGILKKASALAVITQLIFLSVILGLVLMQGGNPIEVMSREGVAMPTIGLLLLWGILFLGAHMVEHFLSLVEGKEVTYIEGSTSSISAMLALLIIISVGFAVYGLIKIGANVLELILYSPTIVALLYMAYEFWKLTLAIR